MKRIIFLLLITLTVFSPALYSADGVKANQKNKKEISAKFRSEIDSLLTKIEFYTDFDKAFNDMNLRIMRYNDKVQKADLDSLKSLMNIEKFKKETQDIFATQFSEKETKELLSIFNSAVYKKLQRSGDGILARFSGITEEFMTEMYDNAYKMMKAKNYEIPEFIQNAQDRIEMQKESEKASQIEQQNK